MEEVVNLDAVTVFHLISNAEKLGIVGILLIVIVIQYLQKRQERKDQKELMEKFIGESKTRGERIEKILTSLENHNQILKEILIGIKETFREDVRDIRGHIAEIKSDIKEMNKKFA